MVITPEIKPKWNAIITDILRAFVEICNEHGLHYFCVGGTAIGAVRHGGMIPWDDDIDVCMPRPDYERFVEVFNAMDSPDYELVTPYSQDNYPLPSMKLCNKKTTLMEDEHTPCVTGLYIDILPVDGTSDDRKEALRLFHHYHKIKNRLSAISKRFSLQEQFALLAHPKEWGQFCYKIIGFFFRKSYRRHLLKELRAISMKYPFDTARNVLVYSGSYGDKEVYPKEWITGSPQFFSFEGIPVALPHDYDAYLRNLFGDYMQLPPMEKRQAKHHKAYFNMDSRESLDTVKQKVD